MGLKSRDFFCYRPIKGEEQVICTMIFCDLNGLYKSISFCVNRKYHKFLGLASIHIDFCDLKPLLCQPAGGRNASLSG